MCFLFLFSAFAFAATPEEVTAHCEQVFQDYDVIGVEVKLPGFKNRIMDVYVEDKFYGQVVIEEKVVTEARCEEWHDPSATGYVTDLTVIDTILQSPNPIGAYLDAESAGDIEVEFHSGSIIGYNMAIRLARVGNFFGFFG
jgi:hypothetical protein